MQGQDANDCKSRGEAKTYLLWEGELGFCTVWFHLVLLGKFLGRDVYSWGLNN